MPSLRFASKFEQPETLLLIGEFTHGLSAAQWPMAVMSVVHSRPSDMRATAGHAEDAGRIGAKRSSAARLRRLGVQVKDGLRGD